MNATKASFNPWPYVIIGYFGAVIVSIVMFVGWTARNNVELVRKDYYADEVLYQKQIDRVARTAESRSDASITFDERSRTLTVGLSAAHSAANPTGTVELYRPSDAKLDQAAPLQIDANGLQRIDAAKLKPGLWKVRVNWTVEGKEFYSDRSIVIGSKS